MSRLWIAMLVFLTTNAFSQFKIDKSSSFYNAPYDSLIYMADIGLETGQQLGASTPTMALMYLNRAIEVQPDNFLAYAKAAIAYSAYGQKEKSNEFMEHANELSASEPFNLYAQYKITRNLGLKTYGTTTAMPKSDIDAVAKFAKAFLETKMDKFADERLECKQILPVFQMIGYDVTAYHDYHEALNLKNAGQTDEAIAKFGSALTKIQNSGIGVEISALNTEMGLLYFSRSDYAKAKQFLSLSCAAGFPEGVTYRRLCQSIILLENNWAEAQRLAGEGLKRDIEGKSEIVLFLKWMNNRKGLELFEKKDYAGAAISFDNFAGFDPWDLQNNLYLFASYYMSRQNTKAKSFSDTTFRSFSDEGLLLVRSAIPNLKAIQAYLKQPTGAGPVIQFNLPEMNRQEEALTIWKDRLTEKKYDEAMKIAQEASAYYTKIGYQRGKSYAEGRVANTYVGMKDYDKARPIYKQLIDSAQASAWDYNLYAAILLTVDNNESEGERICLKGIALFPDESAPIKNRLFGLYQGKGYKSYGENDYATAVTFLDKAVNLNEDPETMVFLGYSYYSLKQYGDASKTLSRAVEGDPNLLKKYEQLQQIIDWLKSNNY